MPGWGSRFSGAGLALAGAASSAGQRIVHSVRKTEFDPRRMSGRGRVVFGLAAGLAMALMVYFALRGDDQQTAHGSAQIPPAASAPSSTSPETEARPDGETEIVNRAYTPRANVEIDVTTRTVSVTSAFSGTEIILFGAVKDVGGEGSASSASAGPPLDIVLAVRGAVQPLTMRRKSNVGGLWLNTDALVFEGVPSFYALSTTREFAEIAEPEVLAAQGIGFEQVIQANPSGATSMPAKERADYRAALLRLKQREGLFFERIGGVSFTGQTLFRSNVRLPANVPVGPLDAEVYVFRKGEFLVKVATRVELKRAGLEKILHELAFKNPLLYGILAVVLAVLSGLAASAIFQRAKR